jgi:hypothetical protein
LFFDEIQVFHFSILSKVHLSFYCIVSWVVCLIIYWDKILYIV